MGLDMKNLERKKEKVSSLLSRWLPWRTSCTGYRSTGPPRDTPIMFKEPLPASHTLEGFYIDDHIIIQILPKKKYRGRQDRFRDEELLELSRDQYKRHGIPTSESKAFSKADRFTAWGTEVDSKSGRVGTP